MDDQEKQEIFNMRSIGYLAIRVFRGPWCGPLTQRPAKPSNLGLDAGYDACQRGWTLPFPLLRTC